MAEFWEDKVVINMDSISAFVEPIIEKSLEARKELKAQTNEEEDDDTLLGELIRLTDDKSVIKDQTINILVASRDTVSLPVPYLSWSALTCFQDRDNADLCYLCNVAAS